MSRLLAVRDLQVAFETDDGLVEAVGGVSFAVEPGQTLAVVGESGSGKSVTGAAIMGLHDRRRTVMAGSIELDGEELLGARPDRLRQLRGRRMAMIFQDPLSALHPFYSIGRQLVEAVRVHRRVNARAARSQAIELLARVGIPQAQQRARQFPHQLSGGLRQRVLIAMALVNDPALLIADEPTTALDVTVQAQIMELLREIQSECGTAIILITHDLGVVAESADEVAVMYGGRVVEQGPVREVFYRPQMPYTWGLLRSLPRLAGPGSVRLTPIPGQPPSPLELPSGCVFAPRCEYRLPAPSDQCEVIRPELALVAERHWARCHLSADDRARWAPGEPR